MDFDFLPSNLQIAYPFQQNVIVERFGADTYLAPIVAAAQVRTIDQRDESLSMNRVYLETTDDFATFDEAYIKLVWATSGDVIELDYGSGTTDAVVQAYGNWVVVEFYATEEQSGVDDIAIKMVFPVSAIENAGAYKVIEITEKNDTLLLHESLIKQGPNEVRRVYWKRGNTLELVADRGEELILQSGFNMSIAPAEEVDDGFQAEEFTIVEGRPQTKLAIDAISGAGKGQYLLCPGALYLLTLNSAGPTSQGDVKLKPLDCYWLERELVSGTAPASGEHGIVLSGSLKSNELRIKNGCGPCCSCEAYVDTYDHLREIWNRGKAVSDRIYAIRDTIAGLSGGYEDQTYPPAIILEFTEDGAAVNVTAAYVNTTDETVNTEEYWDTAPLMFDMSFTPLQGIIMRYTFTTGRITTQDESIHQGPTGDTKDTFNPRVYSRVAVPPKSIQYWSGSFRWSSPPIGQKIECTCIIKGGGGPDRTGSYSLGIATPSS
jgi:hypothetical protein